MPLASAADFSGARIVAARRFDDRCFVDRDETVGVETPVALAFNDDVFAVMLATPTDLEDFARGFALTEGVVDDVAEIGAVEVRPASRGVEVRAAIPEARALALRARRRAMAGRSGCGVCGADSFAEALRPIAPVAGAVRISPAALSRAVAELSPRQTLNARVGSVHAAAFADCAGALRVVREDVGRHNALDKTIGALARAGLDPAQGFVVVSSRCAYELVHKTAAAGIGLIAAVSAPTSLAVELAEKVGVGLVGFAREGRFTVYATPSRVG